MRISLNPLCLVLFLCGFGASGVLAGERVDLERQLHILDQGNSPPLAIGGAQYRVGVFTFEDPDATGLGNALAELVAHDILLHARSRSLGVLIFTGGLAPSNPGGLSYFDKVERVAVAQKVSLVVWGAIRRSGHELQIETYLQIPEKTLGKVLTVEFTLPSTAGADGSVLARLRPDRFAVQRLTMPAEGSGSINTAVRLIRELRKQPQEDAGINAVLRTGELFYPIHRSGGWVKLQVRGGESGWVPLQSHCRAACAPLLHATGFVRGILAYVENRALPKTGQTLTTEALAVREQLEALDKLRRRGAADKTLTLAYRWSGTERLTGWDDEIKIDRGRGIPPGGAAFANIAALAKLKRAIDIGRRENRSPLLDKGTARDIAFELAEASQYDPRNPEVLHNIKVLFDYVGDTKRATLARQLVQGLHRQ